MQRVRHENVTNDVQTQIRHNTRMRMRTRTHNAKPREREKKTISLHDHNQTMTKGIKGLGREVGTGTRTPRDRRCPRRLASPI